MAHYEINRIQDRIIVVSDADTTEVSLTPLNGTEADYFIEASTDHMWKRVGSDAAGYDYTDLGAIGGGGGGGGNVVDTLAATLVAGRITGGTDIEITDGDDVVFLGNSSSIIFPIDSSTTQSKITTGTYGMQVLSDNTPVLIFDNNLGQITTPNTILAGALATGVPSAQNGTLGFKNSADNSEVTLSSTAAKQLKIDNTGHDAEVGINGDAVAGVALNVVGAINVDAVSLNNTLYSKSSTIIGDSAGAQIIILGSDLDNNITLTAPNGVATSAGLTVGGVFKATSIATKSNDYTISAGDFFIDIDASANTVEITAPSATGQIAVIRANDITFAATVALTTTTYTFATAGDSVVVYYDGNNSRIISEYKQ